MKMKEMIRLAADFARSGDQKRSYFLGAIGVRSDGVVVMARNDMIQTPEPSAHAEARLVRKLGKDASMVVVVRVLKGTGKLAMAKPCKHCQSALKNFRVKKVYFTTDDGELSSY